MTCRLAELPEANPDSKHVVIMKLHMISTGLKADQALAFKALAVEALEAGYHFFILHERVGQTFSWSTTWASAWHHCLPSLLALACSLIVMM